MATDKVSLLEVFGYPPDNLEPRTTQMIRKSMPVVQFFPSIPQFQNGLNLFTLADAWPQYSKLLLDNGYTTTNGKDKGVQCAFLADNFPTDTFTNEYGENFLQKFTDVASEGAASIAQMMGVSDARQGFRKIAGSLAKSDNAAAAGAGKGMGWLGDMAGAGAEQLRKVGSVGKSIGGGIDVVSRLAAGSRIDFPMVWKSSSYQPSYSFTIRLYNPYPQNDEATDRFIVGPIVAIMLMAVPRAQDSSTFTWPFLHRIECPGIFNLDPGYISNVTIVKGGDQQQISLNQRLGMVDIRIDVGSLYSSMLGGSNSVTSTRPTVLKYAKAMAGLRPVTTRIADNENFISTVDDAGDISGRAGVNDAQRDYEMGKRTRPQPSFNIDPLAYNIFKTPVSPKIQAKADNPSVLDRVSAQAKSAYDKLKALA